jgi:hypothetical protein
MDDFTIGGRSICRHGATKARLEKKNFSGVVADVVYAYVDALSKKEK